MTEEEKKSVERLENFLDDISKNGGCVIDIDYQHKEEYEAMWEVLNLIQKQKEEIERLRKQKIEYQPSITITNSELLKGK